MVNGNAMAGRDSHSNALICSGSGRSVVAAVVVIDRESSAQYATTTNPGHANATRW